MKKKIEKKIGILGGSFDPAHKGHLKISIEAKKKFGINKIIWAITKKNPFKSEALFKLRYISKQVMEGPDLLVLEEKNLLNLEGLMEEMEAREVL